MEITWEWNAVMAVALFICLFFADTAFEYVGATVLCIVNAAYAYKGYKDDKTPTDEWCDLCKKQE